MELGQWQVAERDKRLHKREEALGRVVAKHALSEKSARTLRLVAGSAMTRAEKLKDLGAGPSKVRLGYAPELKNPGLPL